MKSKLYRPFYASMKKCPECKTVYEDTTTKYCTECKITFRQWLSRLSFSLPSYDYVGALLMGALLSVSVLLGVAVHQSAKKKSRLMTQCMEDGKKEYICEHLLKDQTQTSYWFMNMGGR